jgi:hypothetical protein
MKFHVTPNYGPFLRKDMAVKRMHGLRSMGVSAEVEYVDAGFLVVADGKNEGEIREAIGMDEYLFAVKPAEIVELSQRAVTERRVHLQDVPRMAAVEPRLLQKDGGASEKTDATWDVV